MVMINRRLLPIKAHFLFFMGAMGPILPQLPVLGKQIGISPEMMGYITSILPIMYVLAKPLFGYVADYFLLLRKWIFLLLILFMTLSFGGFYFVPNDTNHSIKIPPDVWNLSLNLENVEKCMPELVAEDAFCTTTRRASCSSVPNPTNSSNFDVYFVNLQSLEYLNLTPNVNQSTSMYVCLPPNIESSNFNRSIASLDVSKLSCLIKTDEESSCIYKTGTFWLFVILLCAGTIGFNVVNSISDAICFDMLGESEEHKYGAQRVWGTIGFGVTALIAGVAVNWWTTDAVKSFTPALVIMLIFSGLDIFSVSKLKLPRLTASESIFKDVWELITHPAIAIFLVFATIAGVIDSFLIYFMFWHVEEVAAETGYMDQIKLIEGCVVAAECLGGEVPFFFYSGKIIKKLGYVHCMSLCFFFFALRLALIAWIPNPWYLVGVEFFFQGCTYALSYTCIVAYASAVAPPGTSATVQGLMAGMDDGLGYSIGSLLGGLAYKVFGGRRSFAYFALLALATCVAHILIRPMSRKQQYLPKTGYVAPKEQTTVDEIVMENVKG